MTTYTYTEKSDLTKEDIEWYSRINGGTATGATLTVSCNGGSEISYVVFKRGTGRRHFAGTVVDWDKDFVVKADYDRFLKIRKADGVVVDNDFDF